MTAEAGKMPSLKVPVIICCVGLFIAGAGLAIAVNFPKGDSGWNDLGAAIIYLYGVLPVATLLFATSFCIIMYRLIQRMRA